MIGVSVDMLLHPSFYGVGAALQSLDEPITQIVYIFSVIPMRNQLLR